MKVKKAMKAMKAATPKGKAKASPKKQGTSPEVLHSPVTSSLKDSLIDTTPFALISLLSYTLSYKLS